jgi:hypothetical protein
VHGSAARRDEAEPRPAAVKDGRRENRGQVDVKNQVLCWHASRGMMWCLRLHSSQDTTTISLLPTHHTPVIICVDELKVADEIPLSDEKIDTRRRICKIEVQLS